MGLLASLGRRGAAAALRGGGHLLVAVVPDNVTPWKLRKTASRSSANFLGWGLKQASKAIKSRKKRKADEQKKRAKVKPKARKTVAPPAFLPWPTWPSLKVAMPSKSLRQPAPSAPRLRPVSPSARPATPAPVLMVVRTKVPDEPRFNKNAWARGAGLSSATDWDKPDRNRVSMRSRLKRAGARKKKPVSPRYNMGF